MMNTTASRHYPANLVPNVLQAFAGRTSTGAI